MSDRKKRRSQIECELNLAAMLDMAFQLLTFFILTFNPPPVERKCDLKMPPAAPVAKAIEKPGAQSPMAGLLGIESLVISAMPSERGDGSLGSISVGEVSLGSDLAAFDNRLRIALIDESSPFEQVIIRVGSGLHYNHLLSVLTVCYQQKLKSGEKLRKVSFVELPEGSG